MNLTYFYILEQNEMKHNRKETLLIEINKENNIQRHNRPLVLLLQYDISGADSEIAYAIRWSSILIFRCTDIDDTHNPIFARINVGNDSQWPFASVQIVVIYNDHVSFFKIFGLFGPLWSI